MMSTKPLTLAGLACPHGVEYRPVCGVVALAAATGITFDEAWWRLAKFYGPNWGGRTHDCHRHAVMRDLGVKTARVRFRGRKVTLGSILGRLQPGVRFVVRTTDHVQIIADGMVLDQQGIRPAAGDWTARKLVKSVTRIIEE